jgi:hypothetical protein
MLNIFFFFFFFYYGDARMINRAPRYTLKKLLTKFYNGFCISKRIFFIQHKKKRRKDGDSKRGLISKAWLVVVGVAPLGAAAVAAAVAAAEAAAEAAAGAAASETALAVLAAGSLLFPVLMVPWDCRVTRRVLSVEVRGAPSGRRRRLTPGCSD